MFTRSGSTWEQQGPQLTINEEEAGSGEQCGAEAAECGFGHSVALSADGNTAIVGAPSDHSERGAAWVFTRTGNEWSTHAVELNGGETQGGHFGADVALSADGATALVGAPGSHREQGAAWVFARTGSSWTQPGRELTGGPEASGAGGFGGSVALSADGGTALIGARFDARVGAAWVFTLTDSIWKQQGAKLTGGDELGVGRFGGSVALSAFGDTALIGGPTDAEGVGAAWVFTRAGSTWEQQGAKLTADDELGEGHFGSSVALSGDGQVALIGAPPRRRRGSRAAVRALWRQLGTAGADARKPVGTDGQGSLRGERRAVLRGCDGADRRSGDAEILGCGVDVPQHNHAGADGFECRPGFRVD